ncbi:hypothetical protein [Pseudonocardia sp. H11422]|uniref:hypothetical protein n=1 Tax=Pseudonocardia sp. H11422 TaxID=2835866 RepID=UPI002027DF4D|nr:hypothetical protein [Pseudonocardia sp. H11422]
MTGLAAGAGDLTRSRLGSALVALALAALAVWFCHRWRRNSLPRQDNRTSEYVNGVAGLTVVLGFLGAGVVIFGSRALDAAPPGPLVDVLAVVMVLAAVSGLIVGGALRWWEPRAAARRDAQLRSPGPRVRWQVQTVATLGAILGVFVAGVATLVAVFVGWVLAPAAVAQWFAGGELPVWLLVLYVLVVVACAGGAGYWQAVRIRRDQTRGQG